MLVDSVTKSVIPYTGEVVTIKEALKRGILDKDLSTYKDLMTGETYSIQEAIDNRLLVATLEDPNKPKDETGESVWLKFTHIKGHCNVDCNNL